MTPLAHSAIGFLGWKRAAPDGKPALAFLFVALANLHDLDFLVLAALGAGGRNLHQQFTHNLLFSLLAPLVLFPLIKPARIRWGLVLVSLSHLPLDLIIRDPVAPVGFPLFYPLWKKNFNLGFFPNIWRGGWGEVVSFHNLCTVLLEVVVVVLPVIWLCRRDTLRMREPERL